MKKERRDFIGTTAFGLFGIWPILNRSKLWIQPLNESDSNEFKIGSFYPSTDLVDQKEIVGAAHTQFEKVKELVTARPELAKATFDWGFGDVESALGAASHMGRKDIAEVLIENGARPNIFTFAMLGKLGAVKSMIEAMPGVEKINGPHGITLLFHAQMRLKRKNVEGNEKEEQEALVEYLKTIDGSNNRDVSLDISSEEQKKYLGKYIFGDGEDEYFEVKVNNGGSLSMARGDYFGRVLKRVDRHIFAPGGAPSVRIHFEVIDDNVISVTVHDPIPIIKANRL